jgi:hypothetical protein
MLVEQIDPHGHRVLRQRFEGALTECCVGRDLGCAIVVDDEHAAPRHALLTLLEDGRVSVRDLGTRNGTRVDGNRVPADTGAVIEQGEIIVGRTRLLVRTLHTPIGQERVFRREFVRRNRTILAIAGVSACMAYAGFTQWLDAPLSMFRSIMTAVLVALGLIALWTGLWALATKLNHGSWHVRIHLTIASIGAAFCAWTYWLAGLVAFAAQWSGWVQVGIAVIGVAALLVVYLHLREATHYERRIVSAMAVAATVVIGAVASIISIGVEDGNVGSVDLGPDVRLEARRVVPNRDIAEYLVGVDKLKLAAGRERQQSLLNVPLADDEEPGDR